MITVAIPWTISRVHRLNLMPLLLLVFTVLGVFALLTTAALFYPADRFRPRTYLGDLAIGAKTPQEVELLLASQAFEERQLTLQIGATKSTATFGELGFGFNYEDSLEQVSNSQKVIDPSVVWLLQAKHYPMLYQLDEARLRSYLRQAFERHFRRPQNASFEVKNGEIVVYPDRPVYALRLQLLENRVREAASFLEPEISFQLERVDAKVSQADLEHAQATAYRILNQRLILHTAEQEWMVPSQLQRQWVKAVTDIESGRTRADLDQFLVNRFFDSLVPEVEVPAQPIRHVLINGVLVSQTPGKSGLQIDRQASLANIKSALIDGIARAELVLETVEPPALVNARYTRDLEGVRALLNAFLASYGGQYGIVIYDWNGGLWVDHNGQQQYVTASTYKMFLAYAVLLQTQQGQLGFDEATSTGLSVRACLVEMITNSTNPCAISLGQKIGWANADWLVHDAGFTATTLNNYDEAGHLVGDKLSTPADEARFLYKLNRGLLLNAENTNFLLSLLKTQHYRNGIPSGVPLGVNVADKVGFLSPYLHDVGIVYGSKQSYILAIMSQGGSWSAFANLSRQVYSLFNQ